MSRFAGPAFEPALRAGLPLGLGRVFTTIQPLDLVDELTGGRLTVVGNVPIY